MKYLSQKYDDIVNVNRNVAGWLDAKNNAMNQQVENTPGAKSLWPVGMVIFLASFAFFLGVLIWMSNPSKPPYAPWDPWPSIGTWDVCVGFFGLAWWIFFGKKAMPVTERIKAAKRAELQAELDGDPLYARAQLITLATHDYWAHCCKYRAWFDAVDTGISEPDEELAERYHAFIDRAHGVLTKAVNNFQNASTLLERQQEYRKEHPELGTRPDSTALSDLIAQLNEPVEMPPELALAEPRAALEFEETLAKLGDDMEGRTLAQRIESAAARPALTAKST